MKLGILTDIHEHHANLRAAIDRLQARDVDQLITLGDVFEMGLEISETVEILKAAQVTGVWGNHDLGFCLEPDAKWTSRYEPRVVEYLSALAPRMVIDDIHCSHGMPDWDPTDPEIFYLGDSPWDAGAWNAVRSQFSQRIFLLGHYHRWLLLDDSGESGWRGESPIELDPHQRYLIVIAGVKDGYCAELDTGANLLTPLCINDC